METTAKNNGDGHANTLIDDYIAQYPEAIQTRLNAIRDALREVLPDAQELIAWKMPTYKAKKNIIHFAAYKNHIGIYPGDKAIEMFSEALKDFKTSKGAIQIQNTDKLPIELIKKIAKWNEETGNHH